ncbi:MAG TPA: DUF4349 domain-containing protein [Candidatus Limnocylindrales bacterium]|nr:DUF4349 domain-containing protein [Candidatus Limnocylindrales bacterium]
MSPELHRGRSLLGPAIALLAIVVLAGGVLTLLGTQVSGILSTVGASIGNPDTAGGGGGTSGGEQAGSGEGAEGDQGGAGSASGDGSDAGAGSGAGDGGTETLLDVTHPELLVIKTGEITIQVGDIDAAVSAATRAIDGLGGYVSGSSRSGGNDDSTATVTFRLPAGAWDAALVALRSLGGTILDEHSETDDVTGKVVDLDAHVRNLQTTEAALASIMAKATTIKDVLTVQDELTDVRGQIEELQSESSHLREQAAYSTLTLQVRRTPAPVVARQERQFEAQSEADSAVAYLVKVGQKLAKAGIWVAIVWLPLLLGVGFAGGFAFLVYRRLRRAIAPA